jgi:hypothetical protein
MVNVHQGHANMYWGLLTCLGPCYHVLSYIVNPLVSPGRLIACTWRHLSYLGYMLIGLDDLLICLWILFNTSWSWWPCLEILLHCLVGHLVCSGRPLSCWWRHLHCQEDLLTCLGSMSICLRSLYTCLGLCYHALRVSDRIYWATLYVHIDS